MEILRVPVVIVGAGLVGPTLALDLGWRNQRCLVVEQGNGVIENPRTGGISVRTMEHYRRLGVADEIRTIGFPEDYPLGTIWCTSLNGYELARNDHASLSESEPLMVSPETRRRAPQLWLDPLIQRAASRYDGVTFRYHCRVESVEQHADGVVTYAVDDTTGERLRIESDYLVGCDGADSLVRRQLGIEMIGKPAIKYCVSIFFRCPRLVEQIKMGAAERWILVDVKGTFGNVTVVDGNELWRLTILGGTTKFDLDNLDAAGQVRRALGSDDIDFEILAVGPWRITELAAERFSVGRIFLAGDAAHTMSPTGGFGANTGIGDSIDLGWKLSAVLDGWGGHKLLDSYHEERRPIAIRNAAMASQNLRTWFTDLDLSKVLEDSAEGEATRRSAGQALLTASNTEGTGFGWQTLGLLLGYRYEDSPICVPDGTPPTPDHHRDYVPTSRPGSRAPHSWLPDGRSTLDLFGRNFTLLRFGSSPPDCEPLIEAAATRAMPVDVVDIDDQPTAELYERRLVLVRPDGHVAWRGDRLPEDPGWLLDVVRGAVSRIGERGR